jgi:serine/threonine-protein kinase
VPQHDDDAATTRVERMTLEPAARHHAPIETLDTPGPDAQPAEEQDPAALRAMIERANDRRAEHETLLATGGMGTIDIVRDRALNRRAAMKRLHDKLADDTRSVRMFVREAQVTGQLEHPNIVPVHQFGVDDHHRLFFTMKLVEGRTLLDIIRELPPPPLPHERLLELLEIVIKVCDALAYAHSRGVLHCDVKPANVMVGDFGQVYLMDWGVARIAQMRDADPTRAVASIAGAMESTVARTQAGYLVGTPTHMPPEQAMGRNTTLDVRADVFAVGALIYHVLSRRAPYQAETSWAAIAAAQQGNFPKLESLVPPGTIPRALVRIVEQAMTVEPDGRQATVAELRDELARFLRGGDSFRAMTFAAGEVIVREGDPGDAAYIIQSGTCVAYKGSGSERRVLRTMSAGEVFGEMAIFAPGPRTASVEATEPTVVHVVNAQVLEGELDSLKPWFAAFVRTLAERFRQRELEPR